MKTLPMFYLVSKALGYAMKQGRKNPRGTVYGIYATAARAETERKERGLGLCSVIVAQ